MTFDPLLKEVIEISKLNYFELIRIKFWKNYADYLQVEVNPSWFLKDSYTIPMVDLDLSTGKQFTTTYEPSLSGTVRRDVRNRFATVQINIARHLDGLEKEVQQKNFLRRVQKELQMVHDKIKSTEDNSYPKNIIEPLFQLLSEDLILRSKLNLGSEPSLGNEVDESDNSTIYYKYCEEEEGKIALEDFCRGLNKSGLIEKSTLLNLRKIFSDRPVSKKVIWKGGKNEFLYFFQELRDRQLFTFNQIWKAASKNFILQKKDGTFYSNNDMRGVAKLRSGKKRMRIDALIEILEVEH